MPTYRSSSSTGRKPKLDRKALRIEEAAEVIGVSSDWFRDQVLPEIEAIRRGRMTLVPAREIDLWLEAEKTGASF